MISDLTAVFIRLIQCVADHRLVMLFLVSAGLGAAGALLIAEIPFREHLLDAPSERSSHTTPTPQGGGIGILAALIVAGLTLRIPTTFLFAALLVSAVSFYGDYFRLSIKFRLAVHLFSALILLFPFMPRLSAHFALSAFKFSPFIFLLILALIILFLIGTANFYNFMDGINGMAGLSGAIAYGLLGVYTVNRPGADSLQISLSLLSLCIALACLGYLPFNMPRARVFMGDGGSILLGFAYAALVVVLGNNYLEMTGYAALLFPFYADALTTMAIRLHDHENVAKAHRRHLYQLLVNESGLAHWKVTLIYSFFQLTVGIITLMLCPLGAWPVLSFLFFCFAGFAMVSLRVRAQTG